MTSQIRTIFRVGLFLFALLAYPAQNVSKDPKLSPQELVTKSLEAIGSPERLAARKSCIAEGVGTMLVRTGGSGSLVGRMSFLSEGDKFRYDMKFDFKDYTEELFTFDGQNAEFGYIRPGKRSRLGEFLYTYSAIVREGLIGGVLSTAWPLTKLDQRNPKLQYRGLTKIEGKQMHEVKYQMKKGDNDLNVLLYFDPATFRHVATVYRIIVPVPLGRTMAGATAQNEDRYELFEYFEDFRDMDGLMLPSRWTIHLTTEAGTQTFMGEWETKIEKISFNQPIEPKTFILQ
jgi:hypothetical protein